MTGFSDRTAQGILNHITGKSGIFVAPTAYVALFTAAGIDAGTGFTEVSVGSYARKATAAADWNTATGSAPSSISNANALTFVTATADWGTVIAWGLYDASVAGNLLVWDYFGNYPWQPATVSVASPGVLTAHAHGFSVSDQIIWSNEYGGTVPTFSQSNFTGLLTVTSPTTDTFTVTNTALAVNTSSTGNGLLRKVLGQAITNGTSAAFPIGSLVMTSA